MLPSKNDGRPVPRIQLPTFVRRAGVVGMLMVFVPLGFVLLHAGLAAITGVVLIDVLFQVYCGDAYMQETNGILDESACGFDDPVLFNIIGAITIFLGAIILILLWFYRIFLLLRYR